MKEIILFGILIIFSSSLVSSNVLIGQDQPTNSVVIQSTDILSFLGLKDTPSTYSGNAGYCVTVDSGGTGLEFQNCTNTTVFGTTDYTNVAFLNNSQTFTGDNIFEGDTFIRSYGIVNMSESNLYMGKDDVIGGNLSKIYFDQENAGTISGSSTGGLNLAGGANGIIFKSKATAEGTLPIYFNQDNYIRGSGADTLELQTDLTDDDTGILNIFADEMNLDDSGGGAEGTDVSHTGNYELLGDMVIEQTALIDDTDTEALLVRKSSDGGDVFIVDTTNDLVNVTGEFRANTMLEVNNSIVSVGKYAPGNSPALEVGRNHTPGGGDDQGASIRIWGNSQASYGDIYITQYGQLGFDNSVGVVFDTNLQMRNDNEDFSLGNGNGGKLYFRHSTAGNDHGRIATKSSDGTETHNLVYSQWADITYDYGFPLNDNPTFWIVSQNQAQDEYIMFQHNTTDALISSGSGELTFNNTNVRVDGDMEVTGTLTADVEVSGMPIYFTCGENAVLDNGQAEWSCGGNGETLQNVPLFDDVILTDVGMDCNTAPTNVNITIQNNEVATNCTLVGTGAQITDTCTTEFDSGDWFRPFTVTAGGGSQCVITIRFETR